jgi:hypothetical protein
LVVDLGNDGGGELLVLGLATEGERVLWASSWDLVDAEPLVGSLHMQSLKHHKAAIKDRALEPVQLERTWEPKFKRKTT